MEKPPSVKPSTHPKGHQRAVRPDPPSSPTPWSEATVPRTDHMRRLLRAKPPTMEGPTLTLTPKFPPDTSQPPIRPRPQCPPDTSQSPVKPRPQCPSVTSQPPIRPRPQCPPDMSQPAIKPRHQCPSVTSQPPIRPRPQCPPDMSQPAIKPRPQCPPVTSQPPIRPRPQCPPDMSQPAVKPRHQCPHDSGVLAAGTSDNIQRPSNTVLPSIAQSDPIICVVGVEPPSASAPPCVQRLDATTGSTVASKASVGPMFDASANRSQGSELKLQSEETGALLCPEKGGNHNVHPHTSPEEEDAGLIIPLDEEALDNDQNKRRRKKLVGKRKRENKEEPPVTCDLDQALDRALEDGAKHHNLTAVNVRNILHEVITNEHVVAMMKAAINETKGLPPFEPKMTRSKLKEEVEKGVVIPTWNLSPIKKSSKQQFVDIPLEEEDSSDEEYRPEEEEEDETAEESLLESDVESAASSPRGHKRMRVHHLSDSQGDESMEGQQQGRHSGVQSAPMGPPPPPKITTFQDSAFMEELHAVDEELNSHLVPLDSFQTLDESLIAFRTRSKRTLKDVPMGQLEAELKAPDITPDMYEPNNPDDDNWKFWLRSLMQDDVGNEDDDDDDPEYNILEDWDEPDTEDLRNDRAVRITKKEVNGLMEELFETFQDEMGISQLEDEGADDEDSNVEPLPDFNTPQAIRFEESLASLLSEQHRTVRAQLEYLRMRKSLLTKTEEEKVPAKESLPPMSPPAPKLPPIMSLSPTQRKRLQQQMQQHVQLLTQLHLLSFRDPQLCAEADTAHMYLAELSTFAENSALTRGAGTPGFQSTFRACNLKDALQLIPLVHGQVPEDIEPPRKNVNNVPNLSQHTAWILATRPVFMYPELLPVCALKPKGPQDRVFFTKAEDNLLALGLKHFEGLDYSKQLISKYLLPAKTAQQLTARIKNLTMKKSPDNIIKFYKKTKMLPALSGCCEDVLPQAARPPVEREKHRLPFWIKASLSSVEAEMKKCADSRYPLLLPPGVSLTLKPLPRRFYRKCWRQRRPALKPLLIRPNPVPKPSAKLPVQPPLPFRILGQVPPLMQPAILNIQPVGVPLGRRAPLASFQKRPLQIAAVPQTQGALSAVTAQRARKSLIAALPKKKAEVKPLGARAAPVVFAVPHGALKLVSLGTACGVLQPLSAGPLTTLLLNPPRVPLSQAPIPQEEWDSVSITIKVEEDDVTPEVRSGGPQSVPLQSLAASPPISKSEEPGDMQEPEEGNQPQNTEAGGGDSPKNNTSSTDGDVEVSSPAAPQRDSSSPIEGPDQANDKDLQEEEEDEDFDDLTQDEDEMSSEESVLSVPELQGLALLQETMEKLTWLASERRLSQEGDSEDNSQEENTEPEEEEEEEECADGSSQKPEEMTDDAVDEKPLSSHHRVPSPAPAETSKTQTAERRRGGSKGQNSHRARNRRGRARASKDASKLLLLYDEKILSKDPQREQKDMAFAQSYLNRVREALQSVPAIYQQFLNLIYEYETQGDGKTAVDLFGSLRLLLQDWPQLLKDFAAFLLPEQALECGLFEEQQAFDKSRRFLRQLEICFQENPAQYQKIIRLLQSCAECPLQEMGKLKTQMWQLLKGHMHLQEEFSLFFDQLRPPPSRMEDFEVMTWTEDKDYAFDGFEEVTLPDVEEEEEQSKVAAPQRSKRRKDAGHGPDKDADWPDGGKECPCSCHDGGAEQRMKRCKRRVCAQCTSKGCESRFQRSADAGPSTGKETAGEGRLPLPKNTSSDDRPSAGQRAGKVRHQSRGASSRGGRRPHPGKSVMVEKTQHCPPEAPGTRSPLHSSPTTSSAFGLNPPPEDPSILQAVAQEEQALTMCAKNIKVSSSGEKVVMWTREADRVILTMCQERGVQDDTFTAISAQLSNKSPSEVSQRFQELMTLFQTGCGTSSDEEEEGPDNLSDMEADEEED